MFCKVIFVYYLYAADRVQSLLLQYFHIDVSPSRYVRVQSLLFQYFTSVYHLPGMSGFSHYYFSTSHRCITLQVCQGSVIITSVLHIGVSPSRYVRVQSLLLQYFHISVSPSRYVDGGWLVLFYRWLYHCIWLVLFSMYSNEQFGRLCRVHKKVFAELKENIQNKMTHFCGIFCIDT